MSVFAVLMIAFSGCVGSNTPAANGTGSDNTKANVISGETASEISTIKNLPAGFVYLGNRSLSTSEINNTYNAENVSGVLGGSEGIYQDSNKTDFDIDVIQLENKEAANNFISTYKSSFAPLNGSFRFAEDSFNGHPATVITDYVTEAETTVPRYYYVWNNENYVLVVYGNTGESSLVRQLAEATGY